MAYKTLNDFTDLTGKTVLLRTCYDLPLDVSKPRLDAARVADDARIRDSLDTIIYLLGKKARIIIEPGWMGRPKGEDAELSVAPAVLRLGEMLRENGIIAEVKMAPNALDGSAPRSVYKNRAEVEAAAKELKAGEILVLENARYDAEENANDEKFGAFIASLAGEDALYVNEAEAQDHRPCATVSISPIKVAQDGGDACLGFHYADAVKYIGGIAQLVENPSRGKFVFFLAGKKIETAPGITSKITVASGLLDKMKSGDVMVVQGAVAYTFLIAGEFSLAIGKNLEAIDGIIANYNSQIKAAASEAKKSAMPDAAKAAEEKTRELEAAKSREIMALASVDEAKAQALVGNSFVECKQLGEQLAFAYKLIAKAKAKDVKMIVAQDHIIADRLPNKSGELPAGAKTEVFCNPTGIPAGMLGVAPGPETIDAIVKAVEGAKIILVAGPLAIEDEKIEEAWHPHGKIFEEIGKAKAEGAVAVAAGGDTAATVAKCGAEKSFSIASNAGGATLELIEKGTSPGLEAVRKANAIAQAREKA